MTSNSKRPDSERVENTEPVVASRSSALLSDDFPSNAVSHLSKCNCNCQCNSIDVDRNLHYPSCMVGKAQKYLGQSVEWLRAKVMRDRW